MSKKIAIVGAGISGLACAYLLSRKDYTITVFAKAFSPDITSNRAAAFWFPYHIRNDRRGIQWCRTSYRIFRQLMHDPATGISMKQLIKVVRENVTEEERVWVEFMPKGSIQMMPPEKLQPGVAKAYDVQVPLIETQIFLPYLKEYLSTNSVGFEQADIKDLRGLQSSHDIVINCAGLGARDLCGDENVIPVRGQVALIETLDEFPIYLDNEKPLYIVPRKDAMIVGGTYEENIFEEATEAETIQRLLCNAYEVFPQLEEQKLLGSWAGLRPYRPVVRVERDEKIIHNYGHGGSGFTLSFGCAEEVVRMVEEQ